MFCQSLYLLETFFQNGLENTIVPGLDAGFGANGPAALEADCFVLDHHGVPWLLQIVSQVAIGQILLVVVLFAGGSGCAARGCSWCAARWGVLRGSLGSWGGGFIVVSRGGWWC